MRRLVVANILASIAALAGAQGARAQNLKPVDPWPPSPKLVEEPKREPAVRNATRVEPLDHKKQVTPTAVVVPKGSREAILVDDEPVPPVDQNVEQLAPVVIDPTITPPSPPPIVPQPPQPPVTGQFSPIMPIPTSTIHKAVSGPPVSIPVIIEGPVDPSMVAPGVVLPGPMGDGPVMPPDANGYVEDPTLNGGSIRDVPSLADALPGPYFEIGVNTLQRISFRDQFVAMTRFDGFHTFELDSRDFNTGFAPGVRLVMGWPIGCGWYAESVFYGRNEWNATRTLNGTLAQSFSTFPEIGTFNALQANFRATLDNAEVGTKWAISIFPTSYIHFGFRSLFLEEQLSVAESGTVRVNGGGNVNAVGLTDVLARNRIFGPQIGFEARWNGPYSRFSFDSFVKAGVGADWDRVEVTRSLSNSSVGPVSVFRSATSSDCVTWVEVQTAGTFHITPMIALRAGWQFLSVWGYASAPLQHPWAFFDSHQGFEVESSERAVYQGPFASLEMTWGGLRY